MLKFKTTKFNLLRYVTNTKKNYNVLYSKVKFLEQVNRTINTRAY